MRRNGWFGFDIWGQVINLVQSIINLRDPHYGPVLISDK